MSEKKYFCPSCNNEISFNDTFCIKCGQPLVWEKSDPEYARTIAEPKFFNKWKNSEKGI